MKNKKLEKRVQFVFRKKEIANLKRRCKLILVL